MTDGNALFTVEVVRALKSGGRLVRDERGRWFARGPDDGQELPPRVEATIEARLATLPEELRHDLDVAGLQGLQFSAELVARVREEALQDVVLRLGGLCATPSWLLRPGGSEMSATLRLDHFRFRHALFHQHLARSFGPGRSDASSTGRPVARWRRSIPDTPNASPATSPPISMPPAWPPRPSSIAASPVGSRRLLSAYDDAIRHFDRALELLGTARRVRCRSRPAELSLLTVAWLLPSSQSGYNAPATTEVYERLRQLTRQVPPSLESAGRHRSPA